MPATSLPASTEYINPGVTEIRSVDAIADLTAPTSTELDAGTDLTDAVRDATSWSITADKVSTQGLGSNFKSETTGMRGPDGDQSLTFSASIDGQDVRTVLPEGTETHIVIYHGGNATGNLIDIWPVKVASVGKPINVAGTDQARVVVGFAITGPPEVDVVIPAAA
ncbi:MAG TPA: hypothetical protein VFJ19_09330 [Nocardioidaceae bacterium]|nr:hypothetical protein [Nocardioidaceae bacterium]